MQVTISIPKAAGTVPATPAPIVVAGLPSGVTGVASVYGTGPWAIVYSAVSGTTPTALVPGGATIQVSLVLTVETALATTGGPADKFSLQVTATDSGGATTNLAPITIFETTSASITVTPPSSSTQTAGSSFTFSAATDDGVAGIPLVASVTTGTAATTTISPTSFTAGTSATTITASDTTAEALGLVISVSTGKAASGTTGGAIVTPGDTGTINIIPAAPTAVTVSTPLDVTGVTVDYASQPTVTPITASFSDKYGNEVPAPSTCPCTVTFTPSAGTLSSTTAILNPGDIATTASITWTPPTTYGTFSLISAKLVIPSGTLAGTYTGSSKQIITGTFDTTSPQTALASTSVAAGTAVAVTALVTPVQTGVPVNFALSGSSTTFSGSLSAVTAMTNSSGYATVTVSDTVAGEFTNVVANLTKPLTGNPTNTLAYGLPAASPVTWVPGSPASFVVNTYQSFTAPSTLSAPNTYVGPSKVLYVDVSLADAYGNPTGVSASSPAIQVTLTASAGGLTSTTVYITAGKGDTVTSGYIVQYTAPATLGNVSLTASTTAPGIAQGSETISVVSLNPSVAITSPSTATVSSVSQTIAGYGVPSKAAVAGSAISTFKYSLNGANNVSVPITGTNSSGFAFFSFSATLKNGSNTLTVYTTDSNGAANSVTVSISVSPAVPPPVTGTFVFPTAPGEISTSLGPAVNATIMNNSTAPYTAWVYASVANSVGQTVYIGVANFGSVAAGSSATLAIPLVLAPGTYTISVFALTPSGIAVSATQTLTVTI